MSETPRTMFQKIWDRHVVETYEGGSCLLWIDRHVINEGASIQAFADLKARGIPVARPEMHLGIPDHVVPTKDRDLPLKAGRSRDMIEGLERNAKETGIVHIPYRNIDQGICHVVAPELAWILPGMTAVCGDSHTSTLGALGAVAFGIGTSELAHVLATGTLVSKMPRMMEVRLDGELGQGVTAKDMILTVIGTIGTAGGTGCAIEFTGSAVEALEIEGRLTLCNMAIEGGARSGIVAPDEKTYAYLKGRRFAPRGETWEQAEAYWRTLPSDPGAQYDKVVVIDAAAIAPQVTWGTSPQDTAPIDGLIPAPASFGDVDRQSAAQRALDYQQLQPGMALTDIKVDRVFIGSCTNSRLSDLREASRFVKGRKLAPGVIAFVSPGSTRIKQEAEAEGLDRVFTDAGFEWRASACSMCCGGDAPPPGSRVAATSNRNFEHRQGRDVRTHIVSPAMAAASAIAGHFVDTRAWETVDA